MSYKICVEKNFDYTPIDPTNNARARRGTVEEPPMHSLDKVRSIAENSGDCFELGRHLTRMCNEVEQLREQLAKLAEVANHCPDCDPEIQAIIERHLSKQPLEH